MRFNACKIVFTQAKSEPNFFIEFYNFLFLTDLDSNSNEISFNGLQHNTKLVSLLRLTTLGHFRGLHVINAHLCVCVWAISDYGHLNTQTHKPHAFTYIDKMQFPHARKPIWNHFLFWTNSQYVVSLLTSQSVKLIYLNK